MSQDDREEDWKLARRCIHLVLNNKYDEAKRLFADRGDSIPLSAGYLVTVFMHAMMSFDQTVLDEALNTLKDLEVRCSENLGWLSTIKNKVFGTSQDTNPYRLLEQQITLADIQVCHAVLNMMVQDSAAGLVKSGWALRKAWNLYHSAYKDLAAQYRKVHGFSSNIPEVPSLWRISDSSTNTPLNTPATTPVGSKSPPFRFDNPNDGGLRKKIFQFFSPVSTPQICPEEVQRLMCAVSFGYGLFHLCVSLLPATALRVVHFLGFASDRKVGVEALIFSRTGSDMRAPLASLALLCYHTVMNPMFTHFNSDDLSASIQEAESIILESNKDFPESYLFLFFKGRLFRLKNKLDDAVGAYTKAVKYSGKREFTLLCLHEVGWCYLMQLDFQKALKTFVKLKRTKGIKHFYTYLSALCYGCLSYSDHVAQMSESIRRIEEERECELESKISRRSALLDQHKPAFYYRLLVYEMMYLWDSLPSKESIAVIVQDCEAQGDSTKYSSDLDPIVGLRSLILGVCLGSIGRHAEAIEILSSVKGQREKLVVNQNRGHNHISAFTLYEIAILLMKEGKPKEAKDLLETVLHHHSSYDFEVRLTMKIHSALKEISTLI